METAAVETEKPAGGGGRREGWGRMGRDGRGAQERTYSQGVDGARAQEASINF